MQKVIIRWTKMLLKRGESGKNTTYNTVFLLAGLKFTS